MSLTQAGAGQWRVIMTTARYMQSGSRAVAHQVEEQPLTALLIAGATGYLLAYLIHGDYRSREEAVPDYARRREVPVTAKSWQRVRG